MTEAELATLKADDFNPEARDENAKVAGELRKLVRAEIALSFEQERWLGKYQAAKRKPGRPPKPRTEAPPTAEQPAHDPQHAPPLDLKVGPEEETKKEAKEEKKVDGPPPPPDFLKKLSPKELGAEFAGICAFAISKLPADWPKMTEGMFHIVASSAEYIAQLHLGKLDVDPEKAAASVCIAAAGYPILGHGYIRWKTQRWAWEPAGAEPPKEERPKEDLRIKVVPGSNK